MIIKYEDFEEDNEWANHIVFSNLIDKIWAVNNEIMALQLSWKESLEINSNNLEKCKLLGENNLLTKYRNRRFCIQNHVFKYEYLGSLVFSLINFFFYEKDEIPVEIDDDSLKIMVKIATELDEVEMQEAWLVEDDEANQPVVNNSLNIKNLMEDVIKTIQDLSTLHD